MPFYEAARVTDARILLGKLKPLSIPSLIAKSEDTENIRTLVIMRCIFRIEIPKLLLAYRNYLVKSMHYTKHFIILAAKSMEDIHQTVSMTRIIRVLPCVIVDLLLQISCEITILTKNRRSIKNQ